MTRGLALIAAAALVAAAIAVAGIVAALESNEASDGSGDASAATAAFFDDYVAPDGRVIRHDQGGDTVSEGQAYAMLLAAHDGDGAAFESVWSWTRQNLQRDDSLFAWRWQDGAVANEQSASDADTDIAVALTIAAERFGQSGYLTEARRIATAILDHETAEAGDRYVVVAGPWAVERRVVNPSYLAPCDYAMLGEITGDPRWTELRDDAFSLLEELIARGLPPDWLVLDDDGTARAIAHPDDAGSPGRYGLDAARVPARLIGCPEGHDVVAEMAARLVTLAEDGAALAYSLDGERLEGGTHPLGLVANALSAAAMNDDDAATELMERARELHDEHPTYYGSAWIALAESALVARPVAEPGQSAPSSGRFLAVASGSSRPLAPPPTTVSTAAAPTTTVQATPSTTAGSPSTTNAATSTTPATTAPPTTTATSSSAVPTTASPSTVATSTTSPSSVAGATTTTPATATTAEGTAAVTSTTSASAQSATTTSATAAPTPDAAPETPATSTPEGVPADRSDSAGPLGTGDEETEAGDLVHPPADLDEYLPERNAGHARERSGLERQRRHTGSLALASIAATTLVGAALGLRERSLIRRHGAR